MILVDTSAWIEYLRYTGSPACVSVEELHKDGSKTHDIRTCDAVRMEVLAGARDIHHLNKLRELLKSVITIPTISADFDNAARLYRTCRREGETVRNMVDCIVGAVAIRNDASVLHRDVDFEVLARHTELKIYLPIF